VLAYAGGRLHLSNISTPKSLALIKEAKKKGLNVTCDMAAYQLSFDDTTLASFDSHLKVNPPFRDKKDNTALLKGLADGTVDVLVSAHHPQDIESKQLEFDLADFGIISLQTVAHNLVEMSAKVSMDALIEKITVVPRKILGLPVPEIKEGAQANLTLFDPGKEWVLNERTNRSKSANSPYWNRTLKGAAVAVFNKGQYHINP
jgi:dihydroorotase